MPQLLSETQICNLALSKLGPGGGYLTDLNSDDSEQAEALRRVYVAVRDEVLEAHPWRFAQARAALSAEADAPEWGYSYQYSLPSDCLKLLAIEGLPLATSNSPTAYSPTVSAAYAIEGMTLLTDYVAPLNIRYLKRVTATGLFSPTFVAALAARLADEVCETITKSTTRRQALQAEYQLKLKMARRSDQMGRAPIPAPDGAWVSSRL